MVAVTPDGTSKSSTALFPLTTSSLAPGPSMVTFVSMSMVLARVMGALVGQVTENVMVSPEVAAATTAGRDPAPEPLQLLTTSLAALATCAVNAVADKLATAMT